MRLIIIAFFVLNLIAGCKEKDVKIFLIGDSTMAPKSDDQRPKTGWGEVFDGFFNEKVTVLNHAKNGRSTKSFIDEGRWKTVLDSVEQSDFVFIQFGHNDEKENNPAVYASLEDYKRNLTMFVMQTREKNANPVLLTPIVRRRFDEFDIFYDTHDGYPHVVRKLAEELKVPLIDMHKISEKFVVEQGREKSKDLYLWLEPGKSENYPEGVQDDTHLSPAGAKIIASMAVDGIRETKIDIRKFLK